MPQEPHQRCSREFRELSVRKHFEHLGISSDTWKDFMKRWFQLELTAKVLYDKLNRLQRLKKLKRAEQVIKSISQYKMVTQMTQRIPTNRNLISLMHKTLRCWNMKLLLVLDWTMWLLTNKTTCQIPVDWALTTQSGLSQ